MFPPLIHLLLSYMCKTKGQPSDFISLFYCVRQVVPGFLLKSRLRLPVPATNKSNIFSVNGINHIAVANAGKDTLAVVLA